jgi:hypothetical protein
MRIFTNRPEVIEAFEAAALAFPVADGIVDEGELAQAAEIRYRKYGLEYALQTDVIALIRKKVHLKKAFIGLLLDLDEVRDGDRCFDLRKVDSFAGGAVGLTLHV